MQTRPQPATRHLAAISIGSEETWPFPALQPAADAISASACSTMADRLQGSITPPPGYGYAIVSLTAKAFDQDSANTGLHIADSSGHVVANGRASMNTDTVFGEEGMSPVDGRLLLFALPPGHYQVTDAWGNWVESQAGAASGARSPCRLRPALTSVPAAASIWERCFWTCRCDRN
jgi:hypothetical protein